MDKSYSEDILVAGNLREQLLLSMSRMTSSYYAPENFLMHCDPTKWPGDFEGRTLLALITLSKALKIEHENIEKIWNIIKSQINHLGYFGDVFDGKTVNEQQLSGNSWYIRSVCEYQSLKKDDYSFQLLNKIKDNYILQLEPFISCYPALNEERMDVEIGEASGNSIDRIISNWCLSTDTGCVFISIDGITSLLKATQDKKLQPIIEKLIEKFITLDVVSLKLQTHATLSATRGLLNYYEYTKDIKYLKLANDTYQIYKKSGMTINYSNYNWFKRPQWTEPCAVIDSFIVASRLFAYTKDSCYAEDMNRIYLNAIRFAQRDNGGFGCDECLTENNAILSIKSSLYEAYWCCTMRGANGLYEIAKSQYIIDGNNIYIPFYNSNKIELLNNTVKITQITNYPFDNEVKLNIENNKQDINIKLYIPQNCKKVEINGKKVEIVDGFAALNGYLSGEYKIIIHNELELVNCKNYNVYMKGDLLYGEIEGSENKINSEKNLIPIIDNTKFCREEAIGNKMKIVY